jgi:hypothetical protein
MFTQHSRHGAMADKRAPWEATGMDMAFNALDGERERESIVFVEPAVKAEIFLDGLAFATYREGHFHIATYIKQAGPNGTEHVINLRAAMPARAVLEAIPALLSLLPTADFVKRAIPMLADLLGPTGLMN